MSQRAQVIIPMAAGQPEGTWQPVDFFKTMHTAAAARVHLARVLQVVLSGGLEPCHVSSGIAAGLVCWATSAARASPWHWLGTD